MLLDDLQPDELLVDASRAASSASCAGSTLPPARLIARALRWEVYARRLDGPLPEYDVVHALEPLGYDPPGPVEPLALPHAAPGEPLLDEPHTLVVHAGPEARAPAAPRARARAKTVVIHPRHRDVYPVEPHFAHAEHIVTGAGFNAIHETAPFRDRHTAVPFPRELDDQYARAAMIRA